MVTSLKEGDLLQSSLTGRVYGLRRMEGEMVVLEREDGAAELLTERDNLRIFYAKVNRGPRETPMG